MFGRRRAAADRDVARGASADLSATVQGAADDVTAAGSGPWDSTEQFTAMERVDLGSLQVPVSPGLDIQLVFAEQHGAWVTVRQGQASEMQLQVFAAPKSSGLWDEVRGEIAAEIAGAGGASEAQEGTFGTELHARVPAEPGKPQSGLRPVRFVGVNGPRWFLRALFAGQAAMDQAAAAPLEAVLREVVVVRGDQPMPPRDLLELRLPPDAVQALEEQARAQQQQQQQGDGRLNNPPNPFDRGPEMTET
ncbi:MAG: DUF3710 domain-containing protein, partial [Trebonia sp.]